MPLIAVEGADAVGKSTQVALLEEFLSKRAACRGVALRRTHFPRLEEGHFAPLLQKFLTGALGVARTVDPQLVALLFACDRFDAKRQLQYWLAEGDFVLLDRYVASNIAYQCAKLPDKASRNQLRQWIEELEYDLFTLPRADLTLCFDAPLPFSIAQIVARQQDSACAEDVHEADIELQKSVRQMYEAMDVSEPHFHMIRCGAATMGEKTYTMRSPESIFDEVKALLTSIAI